MTRSVEEVGAKLTALGLWDLLLPYNFGVQPKGAAFPYFCTVLKGDGKPVKVRLLMLEGWQTMHDYVRTRVDRNFGFYQTPAEMPHLEFVVLATGEFKLFRHDTGYVPMEANDVYRALGARILWEVYGVMLRLESDGKLPLRFVGEKAVFARVETAPDQWEDLPLEIPDPRSYEEKVTFSKADLKALKDLPLVADDVLDLDFRLMPGLMTKETRPRCVYALIADDPKTKKRLIDCRVSVHPEIGLRGLWESMPGQVVRALVRQGKIPGEIRLCSGRVFRLLRLLCLEVPVKLSLHDKISF